jgi:hypothetical protein
VSKLYKMFIYDLKMTLRQREALFWMFLFPILLMIILGLVFGNSGRVGLKIGIVDLDGSAVSKVIVGAVGYDALKEKLAAARAACATANC